MQWRLQGRVRCLPERLVAFPARDGAHYLLALHLLEFPEDVLALPDGVRKARVRHAPSDSGPDAGRFQSGDVLWPPDRGELFGERKARAKAPDAAKALLRGANPG